LGGREHKGQVLQGQEWSNLQTPWGGGFIFRLGLDILKGMKSLQSIGIGHRPNESWPAAEFWDRYDKGEFAN